MERKEYRYRDRSDWSKGPWDDEPDKIQWEDSATGFPCLMVRGPSGAWCGYVGVPNGHVAYRAEYDNVGVQVHGGLTFAGPCQDNKDEHGICHIPSPGESDDVWWLGFDCSHGFDFTPEYEAIFRSVGAAAIVFKGEYRDVEYVKKEVEFLAEQLHRLEHTARMIDFPHEPKEVEL